MPVIFVRDTKSRPPAKVRKMLEGVNRSVSESLGLGRNTVWVRYEPGDPKNYWEGEGDVEEYPLFVFVNLVAGRKNLHALFAAISSAVGSALGIDPHYVWVRIEEFPLDRVGQGAHSYAELRK